MINLTNEQKTLLSSQLLHEETVFRLYPNTSNRINRLYDSGFKVRLEAAIGDPRYSLSWGLINSSESKRDQNPAWNVFGNNSFVLDSAGQAIYQKLNRHTNGNEEPHLSKRIERLTAGRRYVLSFYYRGNNFNGEIEAGIYSDKDSTTPIYGRIPVNMFGGSSSSWSRGYVSFVAKPNKGKIGLPEDVCFKVRCVRATAGLIRIACPMIHEDIQYDDLTWFGKPAPYIPLEPNINYNEDDESIVLDIEESGFSIDNKAQFDLNDPISLPSGRVTVVNDNFKLTTTRFDDEFNFAQGKIIGPKQRDGYGSIRAGNRVVAYNKYSYEGTPFYVPIGVFSVSNISTGGYDSTTTFDLDSYWSDLSNNCGVEAVMVDKSYSDILEFLVHISGYNADPLIGSLSLNGRFYLSKIFVANSEDSALNVMGKISEANGKCLWIDQNNRIIIKDLSSDYEVSGITVDPNNTMDGSVTPEITDMPSSVTIKADPISITETMGSRIDVTRQAGNIDQDKLSAGQAYSYALSDSNVTNSEDIDLNGNADFSNLFDGTTGVISHAPYIFDDGDSTISRDENFAPYIEIDLGLGASPVSLIHLWLDSRSEENYFFKCKVSLDRERWWYIAGDDKTFAQSNPNNFEDHKTVISGFPTQFARYIRFYFNGNDKGNYNRIFDIQVFRNSFQSSLMGWSGSGSGTVAVDTLGITAWRNENHCNENITFEVRSKTGRVRINGIGDSNESDPILFVKGSGIGGFKIYDGFVNSYNCDGEKTFSINTETGNVELEGKITSTEGSIGGWNILPGCLNSGTLNLRSTGQIDGNYALGVSGWKLSSDGNAELNNALLRGTIYASGGEIGSWNIHCTDGLYSGSGVDRIQLKPGVGIWSGANAIGDAPFSVTKLGAMKSTSGSIANWTIAANTISSNNISLTSGIANTARLEVGSGANSGGVNSANGSSDIVFWAGGTHANRATSNFRVTAGGTLNATGATITGTITATTGSIAGWCIEANCLSKTTTGKIALDSSASSLFSHRADSNHGEWHGQIYNSGAWTGRYGFAITRGAGTYLFRSDTDVNGANACNQIAGWNFNSTCLFSGNLILNSAGSIAGNYSVGVAGWCINSSGIAEFNNVTVRGTVCSCCGTIGGWTIGTTQINAGSGANYVGISSSNACPAFWAGNATGGSATFRVTHAGALTSTSGNIGGWDITSSRICKALTNGCISIGQNPSAGNGNQFQWAECTDGAWSVVTIGQCVYTGAYVARTGISLVFNGQEYFGVHKPLTGGSICAKIAGWNFNNSCLSSGNLILNSAGSISGNYTAGIAGWCINSSGLAEFNNITVRGTVCSCCGLIGGWNLNSTCLSSGNLIMNSAGSISGKYTAGVAGWCVNSLGSAEFNNVVARGCFIGDIASDLATMGGFCFHCADGIYSGTGTTRIQIQAGCGIWAGATTFNDSPFRISASGIGVINSLSGNTCAQYPILSATSCLATPYVSSTHGYFATCLGVGTASPTYSLEIVGTSRVSGNSRFESAITRIATASGQEGIDLVLSGTTGNTPAIRFLEGANVRAAIRTAGTSLNIGTGWFTPRITLLSDGKVGIGCEIPAYNLHVVGTSYASTCLVSPYINSTGSVNAATCVTTPFSCVTSCLSVSGSTILQHADYLGQLHIRRLVDGAAGICFSNSTRGQLGSLNLSMNCEFVFRSGTCDTTRFCVSASGAGFFSTCAQSPIFCSTSCIRTPMIESPSFASGLCGWRINQDGDSEFNNTSVRGELRSSVFVYDEISAVGGQALIANSGNLMSVAITPAAIGSSFSVCLEDPKSAHAARFSVDDIVRSKTFNGTGVADFWGRVTHVVDETTYYRYCVILCSGSLSASFPEGSAVVSYGKLNTGGGILLNGQGNNSPYMDVFTTPTTPWTGLTARLRLGNLDGISGYSGCGYGLWTDNGLIVGGLIQSNNWSTGGSAGSKFDLSNGTFKLGGDTNPKLSFDGTNLNIDGQITATTGSIAGWCIESNCLSKTTTGKVAIDSLYSSFYSVRADPNHGEFQGQVFNNSVWTGRYGFAITRGAGVYVFRSDTDINGANACNQIAGWNFNSACISSGNLMLNSAGSISGNYTSGVAGWCVNSSGLAEFNNVTIRGTVCSCCGLVGGWNIGATQLNAGTGTNYVGISSSTSCPAFWAGNATAASAPFRVTHAGALTASNASVSGTITITTGSGYANLSDKPTSLAGINTAEGNKLTGIECNATVGATWGTNLSGIPSTLAAPSGSGLFLSSTHMGFYSASAWKTYIDNTGNMCLSGIGTNGLSWNGSTLAVVGTLTSCCGSIGGWTIGTTQLNAGSGATYVGISSSTSCPAFWAGSATGGSAPFRVTHAGALTASNSNITGTITSCCGSIANWSIVPNIITSGTASVKKWALATSTCGTGNFYSGVHVLEGLSYTWHGANNAGHLVFGQIATNINTVKTGFYGIQMMDHSSREYFALAAKCGVNCFEVYNRIAGWNFNHTCLSSGNLILNSAGSISGCYTANTAGWCINSLGVAEFNNVTVRGTVCSCCGLIGGWTIGTTQLNAGAGSTYVGISSSTSCPAFWAGNATGGSAAFRVTHAGALTASNADITGAIYASGGSIANWNISTESISSGTSGVKKWALSTYTYGSGCFYSGNHVLEGLSYTWSGLNNSGHLVFGQLASSNCTVKTGFYGIQMMDYLSREYFALGFKCGADCAELYNRIAGWCFDNMCLTSGSGSSVAGLSSSTACPAFWAGWVVGGSAPFRVTHAGALTATSANITGTITSCSGSIGGWTIGTTRLNAGSGATYVGISSSISCPAFWAGNATAASAPFRVTHGGVLTATGANITGTICSACGCIGKYSIIGGDLLAIGASLSEVSMENRYVKDTCTISCCSQPQGFVLTYCNTDTSVSYENTNYPWCNSMSHIPFSSNNIFTIRSYWGNISCNFNNFVSLESNTMCSGSGQSNAIIKVYVPATACYGFCTSGSIAAAQVICPSDCNLKTDFQDIMVLPSLRKTPITKWRFRDSNDYRIGPTAQDFNKNFKLANDWQTNLTVGGLDGVALKAVKEVDECVMKIDKSVIENQGCIYKHQDCIGMLESRNKFLENKIFEMEEKLNKLIK